jgi:hypothetical protein
MPAQQRDIPGTARKYTFDYGGASGVKILVLPVDMKVCGIQNDTNQDLLFYSAVFDGTITTRTILRADQDCTPPAPAAGLIPSKQVSPFRSLSKSLSTH